MTKLRCKDKPISKEQDDRLLAGLNTVWRYPCPAMIITHIKNSLGQLIGTVEDHGDIVEARDTGRALLGRYIKSRGVTENRLGQIVAQGNILASLVWDNGR